MPPSSGPNPQTQHLQDQFNILESKEIQDNLVKNAANGEKERKMMLQKITD